MAGHALPTFRLLREHQLLEHLFPATASELEEVSAEGSSWWRPPCSSTDLRVAEDKARHAGVHTGRPALAAAGGAECAIDLRTTVMATDGSSSAKRPSP